METPCTMPVGHDKADHNRRNGKGVHRPAAQVRWRNIHYASVIALISMTACTSPDLSAEIGSFAEATGTGIEIVDAALEEAADGAQEAYSRQLIQAGEFAVLRSEACDGTTEEFRHCTVSWVPPSQNSDADMTAYDAQRFTRVLRGYVTALQTLASADTSSEVTSAVAALSASVTSFSQATGNDGLVEFANQFAARHSGVSGVLTFAMRQQKQRALRRLVSEADRVISTLTPHMAALIYAELGISPAALSARYRTASNAMELARREVQPGGSTAAYEAATANLVSVHAQVMEELTPPPVAVLYRISDTHAALARRLRGPATEEDILGLLSELQALTESISTLQGS